MDERQTIPRGHIHGELHGIVKPRAVLDDGRAKVFGVFDLIEGRAFGHDDGGRDTQTGGVIGDPLGVVARAARNNTRLFLRVRQGQQFGQRTAGFERIGVLAVFELEVQIDAKLTGQAGCGNKRRADGRIAYGRVGLVDEVGGQGHWFVFAQGSHDPVGRTKQRQAMMLNCRGGKDVCIAGGVTSCFVEAKVCFRFALVVGLYSFCRQIDSFSYSLGAGFWPFCMFDPPKYPAP